MAHVVFFAGSIELLSRYVRERLPARVFIPLSLFLAAGAEIGVGASDIPGYVLRSGVAFGLLLQFRLWDDVESLSHDRSVHPERLLCRVPDPVLVARLLPVLAAANLIFVYGLSSDWIRPLLLVVLTALFAAGYRCAPRVQISALGASHALLIKYPMFVWVLSPPQVSEAPLPLLVAMAVVFLSFGIHEILHDDRLRIEPGARRLAVGESILLVAALMVLVLLHYRQVSGWTAPFLVQCCCAAIVAAMVVRLVSSSDDKLGLRSGYLFFVAGYPAFLAFPSSMNT